MESVLHDTTYPFSNLSMKTTIPVTNRWNRSHLSWIFSKFLTFTLHTFVLTQMCRSPFSMLSGAYFGALKWLQTQINIGAGGNHTSVSTFVTRFVECLTIQWCQGNTFTYILLKGIDDVKNLRASATRNRTQAAAKTIIQLYLRANQAALVGINCHTVFGIHDGP